MSANTRLLAPAGSVGVAIGLSGTTYAIDANGFIVVTVPGDVGAFIGNGFLEAAPLSSQPLNATNGMHVQRINMTTIKNADATTLAAAAAAGKFGIACTAGTSVNLASEQANNNTKTDTALVEVILPTSYVGGTDITLTANALLVGAGTLTTKTLALSAYKTANDGTQGSNLIATAAPVLTTAAADYPVTITGASLNPGDRIMIKLVATLVETGAVATNAQVNSLRLS